MHKITKYLALALVISLTQQTFCTERVFQKYEPQYIKDTIVQIVDTPKGKQIIRTRHGAVTVQTVGEPDTGFIIPDVESALLTQDGEHIITGYKRSIRMHDIDTQCEIASMATDSLVTALTTSPDDRQIISGHNDGSLRVWDGATLEFLAYNQAKVYRIQSALVTPDNTKIITQDMRGNVRVWDRTTMAPLIAFRYEKIGQGAMAVSQDSERILLGHGITLGYGQITVVDIATGKMIVEIGTGNGAVTAIAAGRGKDIISGSLDAADYPVRMWDLRTQRSFNNLQVPLARWGIDSIAYNSEAKELSFGHRNGWAYPDSILCVYGQHD